VRASRRICAGGCSSHSSTGDRGRMPAEPAGFGLGLSIAHDIVKGHGGRIELSDRQPHGLKVSILLPR